MSYDGLHQTYRVQAMRAIVHDVDDTGGDQMLKTESHFAAARSGIQVVEPFGFASRVPLDGAVTVVLAMGGDQSELVALPPRNPSVARFGNLNEGETAVYDALGQRLHFRNGVLVEVQAKSELKVLIGGTQVFDLTAEAATFDVQIVANKGMTASADITTTADVTAGDVNLKSHKHDGVKEGTDTSGAPVT